MPTYKTGDEASLGELVRALKTEGRNLVKAEIALIRTKTTLRIRGAAIAAGLLAAAGLFGLIFYISALIALGIWLTHLFDSGALGALVVAILNVLIAGVLFMIARNKLERSSKHADATADDMVEVVR